MKKHYSLILIFINFFLLFSQKNISSQSDYYFYENKGQIIDQKGNANSKVKYLFSSGGLNVQIRKEGFSYDVYEVEKTKKRKTDKEKISLSAVDRKPKEEFDYKYKFHRVDIDFLNANKNPEIIAEGKSTDYENYYNIPQKPEGVTEVYRYQKVIYKNIYPNVDLVFFKPKDTTKTVEYNFIINPGGKISDIKLKFNGAKTKLKDGKLSMNLRFGEMQENIPHSWIEENTKKTNLSVQFKEIENGVFGFEAPQDSFDKTVVIDPVPTRIWGSYLGGFGEDYAALKTDINSTLYAYGTTQSTTNISTSGSFQSNLNRLYDAFINKITKDGFKIWGSYYGGIWDDDFVDIDFDENLNIYLVGNSFYSNNLYPDNPYYANRDMILVKFTKDGFFVRDKRIEGNSFDESNSIAYNNDKIYFSGYGLSNNLPILNAYQPQKNSPFGSGYADGYLACLDTDFNINWATYFGADDGSTNLYKIFSVNQNIEVLGVTISKKISMINPFQNFNSGSSDGLYLSFTKSGNLVRSSYAGVENQDNIHEARIINNHLLLTGEFFSISQNINGAGIFDIDLNTNEVKKHFFNFPYELQLFSYIDKNGNIYFAALADSDNYYIPPINAYLQKKGGSFFIKFDKNYNQIWGTYYGNQLARITKDEEGYIYFSGMSSNNTTGIATPGTFQQTGGHPSNDSYIAKFADCESNVKVSYTPICNGKDLELKAEGGDTYEWFGPNNFHSFEQNPIIKNAQISDSGEYFVRMTGTNTCGGIFTLNVVIGSPAPPKPDVTDLPTINGNCKTTLIAPTATDGCGNKITATTTDQTSNFAPGTYTITWKYDDGNGNTFTQNQKVIISSPALPTATSPQTFCAIDAPKILNLSITGQNIIWYDNSGNILNTGNPLVDGTTYYASQTINSCESDKIAIQVKVNATPLPTGNANQDFCTSRNAQIKDLAVTGTSLKFYDSLENVLPNTTVLQNNTSYFVTQTLNNCESQKLEIKVTLTANSLPANDYQLTFCNDTTANSKTEDLRKYQENIIIGSSAYNFEYFDQNNNPIADFANRNLIIGFNIFNVKVKSVDGCWKMVQLKLQLNPKPVVNLPTSAEFCKGLSVDIDAGAGFKKYEWTKDSSPTVIWDKRIITISEAGKYTVEVTNSSDCKNTSSTLVNQSILANILKVEITNNDAKVLLSANGDFVYSLDNSTWQNNSEFPNLNNGSYTVYVKTKLGCIIGEMNFTIFDIPNTFTPNSDGVNDTWKITGMENYPNSEITIIDRFGTLVLHKIINGTFEWNGQINQRILPTGTYWYVLKVSDGRILQGSVLIKNRN